MFSDGISSPVDPTWTVPMICAMRGDLDKLQPSAVHDPLLTNSCGETVFLIAAKYGHIDQVPTRFLHDASFTPEKLLQRQKDAIVEAEERAEQQTKQLYTRKNTIVKDMVQKQYYRARSMQNQTQVLNEISKLTLVPPEQLKAKQWFLKEDPKQFYHYLQSRVRDLQNKGMDTTCVSAMFEPSEQ